jgi:hypothetical protein
MRLLVKEVKSNDHPSGFNRIEVLVTFWYHDDSPSYLTLFLEKKEGMTSSKIRSLATQKTNEFLSGIECFH